MSKYISCVKSVVAVVTVIASMLLGGCAAVVYKDAAASYVAASKELTKQLDEVASRLTQAEDLRLRQQIVTDRTCPIEQDRIFVRADPSVKFTPLFQHFPDFVKTVPGCRQLIACERGDTAAVCTHACYSASEGNCVKVLEQEYARADQQRLVPQTSAKQQKIAADAKRLVDLLQQVEYDRRDAIASRLIADQLQVLAHYMDMLEKAALANHAGLAIDADQLAGRINTVTKTYATITANQLASADASTRENIAKSLGVLGKLGGDLRILARNAKDAQQVKDFVRNHAGVAETLITAVQKVIGGDDYLGIVLNNNAVRKARGTLAERYRKTSGPYERGVLLEEALKYRYITAADSQRKLLDVFAALEKSHVALRNLVLAPNDEQLKAIHNEAFQNFKTVAQDVADLIARVATL